MILSRNLAVLTAVSFVAVSSLSVSAEAGPRKSPSKKPAPSAAQKAAPATNPDWETYKRTANRGSFSLGASAAQQALSYRGTRYVFGGQSRNGIDCSGLTQSAYKAWGLKLPRTSTAQFTQGVPVPKGQIKEGDLVFFKNTYRGGVSHVGIYLGDGKFVHAANSRKGVIVSSLSEAYYLNHWAGARRVALEAEPEVSVDDAQPEPRPLPAKPKTQAPAGKATAPAKLEERKETFILDEE